MIELVDFDSQDLDIRHMLITIISTHFVIL